MLIHVKKNKLIMLSSILVLNSLQAQQVGSITNSPPQAVVPPPAPVVVPSPAAITAPPDATSSALDYLFNRKPQDGSVAKGAGDVIGNVGDKVKAVDILDAPGLDDPVVRQRFEIYLKHTEVPADRIHTYADKMAHLLEVLRAGDPFTAWKLLYGLSEYQDMDAGISRELANRVEAVWNTDRTNNGIDQNNDKLRHNVEISDRNADMIVQELREEEDSRHSRPGGPEGLPGKVNPAAPPVPGGSNSVSSAATGGGDNSTSSSEVAGSMQLTAEYLQGLENRAKIKLNEAQQDANIKQAKADFEAYISTLYGSHRYYQVIIAADFYRQIFNEGDYPVAMADQVNASLEVNRNVQLAVDNFKNEADKGEVAGAATMLQTAFVGNEFHPALQGASIGQKNKVAEYFKKLAVLQNVIEARDFSRVEGLIADITKIASDFDSTKPTAMVNGVKLESTLRLGKAKLLAQQGDLTDAMQEFQAAAQAWPGNPDLQNSATGFFSTQDLKTQSVTEFDRLIKDQNYRGVFDKQLAFAPAIHGDATREQQFKASLEKVQKAEVASVKANTLVMNGDVDGAWETIKQASDDWPDDNKLNKFLADLSGRATDFVAAVNKAKDAEGKKEWGYSLSWYLNAQYIYPASVIANDGIDRLSKTLLNPEPAGTAANN